MMKFSFEIKDKSLVTKEEYEKLEWLRFEDGFIWPAFQKWPGYVVIAKKDDLIVGWAFIFKKRIDNIYKTFYVYIKKDYRRNGIGKKIYHLAKIINENNEFKVSRWNIIADKFYDEVEN